MPSSAISGPVAQRTFSASFITFPDVAPWPFGFEPSSFIVPRSPRRRPRMPRPPRDRARARRPDTWQKLAGGLELASDLGRQAARLARSRDARALDAAIDRWRLAVLEAIELHNAADEFPVAQ